MVIKQIKRKEERKGNKKKVNKEEEEGNTWMIIDNKVLVKTREIRWVKSKYKEYAKLTNKVVHGVFIKECEEVCSFRLGDGCHHVLRVNKNAKDSHQLYCTTHLWIRVYHHLFNDDV